MIRWGLVLLLGLATTAVAAPLRAFEPDGWLPVPNADAQLFGRPLDETHAFHPPGDSGVRYLIGETHTPEPPERAVAAALDELARDVGTVDARTLGTRDGRTIGEMAFANRSGLRTQVRIAAAPAGEGAGTRVVMGRCTGTAPVVAVCAPRLSWVTVEVAPPDEDERSPWGMLLKLFAVAIGLGVVMGVGRWWLRARAA